jgi:Ser/Thr protein kinase RdoA (MazF antagonist)
MSQVLGSERRALNRVMRWDDELPLELVERMWREPGQLLARAARLQHKPSCTVVRIDEPAGSWVWKHHVGGALRRLRRAATAPSPAKKAWTDGWFLHNAGIPTPRPRAYVERRIGPFKTSSFFLADFVPGRSLYRLLRYERPAEATLRDLARQTAAIWQRLADLAVCHNDFKTENLLVDRRVRCG